MNESIGRVAATMLVLLVMASPLPAPVQYPDPPPGSTPGAPGCVVPYGYTWSCGYSCSEDAKCLCVANDIDESICMKSSAGAGCGCFDHNSDACCGATGF